MPLYKTIKPNKQTTIYLWKIEASFDELTQDIALTENSKQRVLAMKSEIHQRGFLSVRHLLKEAGYSDFDLYYNEHGKPLLKDGKHISITHSFTFSAIIISHKTVGIDIEKNREVIKKIAHRFTYKTLDSLENDCLIEQLTVIWGAKESLYKIYPHGGLSFKNNIPVTPFSLKDTKTTAWIKTTGWEKKYAIYFEKIENFSLVYALDNSIN